MTKSPDSKTRAISAVIKARLAVEATLVRCGVRARVDEGNLVLGSDTRRSNLHFKADDRGDMELTLVLIADKYEADDLEQALIRAARPEDTELQIVHASGNETPAAVCKRAWKRNPDPVEILRWCAACEVAFWGKASAKGFSRASLDVEEALSSPEFDAAAVTRRALLDHLLEEFGEKLRVTVSNDDESIVAYGLPHADSYFQFAILPGTETTCLLNVHVNIGSLFSRHAYAVKWLLRNCSRKLLTLRPGGEHSRNHTLEVGFCGHVPAGASQALKDNVERILIDARTIRGALYLWFPNLVDGDMAGSALVNSDQPEYELPLLAVSDPDTFVTHWKEFIEEQPDSHLDTALPYYAAFWSGSYATAIEWAERLESLVLATDPANEREEHDRDASVLFSRQIRIRALKALGRYEEALALLETFAANQPGEADTDVELARASLYVRLRRLDEAAATLSAIEGNTSPLKNLSLALVFAGQGREKEAEAALREYESRVGEDIAARALFRELNGEYWQKQAPPESSLGDVFGSQRKPEPEDDFRF